MRTQKRFTPTVLDRFARQGRGEGTHGEYKPWHQVTRGDPASRGRSHLLQYGERLRHLLSDGEFRIQLFIMMLPGLEDVVEQYPLDENDAAHPRCAYVHQLDQKKYPGTSTVSRQLGLRHPICTGKSKNGLAPNKRLWKMTSDFLVVTKSPTASLQFLAVAYKPEKKDLTKRKRELLCIEREFWVARGIPWLLITTKQFDMEVGLSLARTACWALQKRVPDSHIQIAVSLACQLSSASLTEVLRAIEKKVGSLEQAQNALWQAVWCGRLPIDLRRGWRPHPPLRHVDEDVFWQQNPIASRRSAWI